MSDELSCTHVGPLKGKCGLPLGHQGLHRYYEELGGSKFKLHEWNDFMEVMPEEKSAMFMMDWEEGEKARERTINLAIFEGKKALEPGSIFEIRCKPRPTDPVVGTAQKWGCAWYWLPTKKSMPLGFESRGLEECPIFKNNLEASEFNPLGGYVLVARQLIYGNKTE